MQCAPYSNWIPRRSLGRLSIARLHLSIYNQSLDQVEVGSTMVIAGFPLGFHHTLFHMPVVCSAVIASSFGLRESKRPDLAARN